MRLRRQKVIAARIRWNISGGKPIAEAVFDWLVQFTIKLHTLTHSYILSSIYLYFCKTIIFANVTVFYTCIACMQQGQSNKLSVELKYHSLHPTVKFIFAKMSFLMNFKLTQEKYDTVNI